MSDVFTRLREEVEAWTPPAKDLVSVTSSGRRKGWVRRGGATALCLLVLTGVVVTVRALDNNEPEFETAGNAPFELVQAAAAINGVSLERAELDASWDTEPAVGREWPSLLPDGPIPVLVTSSKLSRGLQDRHAWADIIDGWVPGPAFEASSRVSRVFVTLQLVGGGLVHLPVAPPYEWWSDGERPSHSTLEPVSQMAKLEWEGVSVSHPINWRRITFGYDPGGSVTERSGLTITNMAMALKNPAGAPFANRYDMTDAPSDAVVLRISKTSGGPVTGDCETGDQDCESDELRGSESVDYPGNYSGIFYEGDFTIWFWVGKDASPAEIAAFERMRNSIVVSGDSDR